MFRHGGVQRGFRASPSPLRAVIRRRRRLSWLQALLLVATGSLSMVVISALLVTQTDPRRFPNLGTSLWWAVTTVTTVGYGDVVPASVAGRFVAAGLMFVGIASFALLTAVAASAIVVGDLGEEEREIERAERLILEQLRELDDRLARMEDSTGVAGAQGPATERRRHAEHQAGGG